MRVEDVLADMERRASEASAICATAPVSVVLRFALADLEHVLQTAENEALTLAEAARESGYTVAHLRALVSEGTIHDVAETGPVRVRRWALPRKPGYRLPPGLRET